jgi:type III pantothenate kinase
MARNIDFLAIDCGNTAIKIGLFGNGVLTEVLRFGSEQFDELQVFAEKYALTSKAMVSVASSNLTERMLELFPGIFNMESQCKIPFLVSYETPHTLGLDRLCNAAALASKLELGYKVGIDIGTCIKFDVLDQNNNYLGGSIAPGIRLRYKSLNDYTANLPLLDEHGNLPLIGKNTVSSIQSGVVNGIQAEIDGLIAKYEAEYHGLTFFVTGGDALCFDFAGKNNIFVDENLTLKGLEIIYSLNA